MQWNLLKLRKEFGYSQKDVAKILNISIEAYRNKELGKSQFKMNEMFLLSDLFGEDISDIFLEAKSTVRE